MSWSAAPIPGYRIGKRPDFPMPRCSDVTICEALSPATMSPMLRQQIFGLVMITLLILIFIVARHFWGHA